MIDVASHEQDSCGALGGPGAHDTVVIRLASRSGGYFFTPVTPEADEKFGRG